MASLDILCFKPFNLKNKIMKIEHTKIFHGPSKVLKNFSWLINICLKSFMPPRPPPKKKPSGTHSYILRSLNFWQINQVTSKCQMDFLDKTCRSETEKMKNFY